MSCIFCVICLCCTNTNIVYIIHYTTHIITRTCTTFTHSKAYPYTVKLLLSCLVVLGVFLVFRNSISTYAHPYSSIHIHNKVHTTQAVQYYRLCGIVISSPFFFYAIKHKAKYYKNTWSIVHNELYLFHDTNGKFPATHWI